MKRRSLLQVGEALPEVHLEPAAGGGPLDGAELIRLAPVVVVFFHTTCPVCQLSLPFVDRLAQGQGLNAVPVSQDGRADTADFAAAFGLKMPFWLDSGRYSATKSFGVEYVPAVFVIEKDGRISKCFEGFSKVDFEELGARAGVDVFTPSDGVPVFRPG